MKNSYPGEQWKPVQFDFDFINDYRLEISNFGRLRSFNKISDGDILKGTTINGYNIVRLKFFTQRDEKTQQSLDRMQAEVLKKTQQLKKLNLKKENKTIINEAEAALKILKKELHKKFMHDLKKRTINYHGLIHRLVAAYFLKKQNPEQTVVAHLDFNKHNNHAGNLRWMTKQENLKHQQNSPYVIQEKSDRKFNPKRTASNAKLTVTKIMLLKKLLNEGKPIKRLTKQFKVTDTQILRIKRGENWGEIEAAK